MKPYHYPNAPENISDDVIRPSAKFSLEIKKVIALLFLFALVYLSLLVLTAAFTMLLFYIGVEIITNLHHVFAILAAIGIMGIGLMTSAFVIKFLFARRKDTDDNRIEITEEEYPALFDFIRKVSHETATPFPKHIFLSGEVNASVYFHSSFWSMILPVRKNLVIGIGLVNMINLSEFKSIIAHEFGHFAQKSMRAGSYVYHAHKVLYNMLYENQEYISALNKWASMHRLFYICVSATIKLVQGIQWILQQVFKVVNKQYMVLSREMEFHADAMAAKVSGSNNMIHALRRIEFADSCYNTVIQHYNKWLPEHYKGENAYQHQLIAASFIAKSHKIQLVDTGLPLLHDMNTHFKSYSKVNVEDQWASHPTRLQREAALNKINIEGKVVHDSAWVLFDNNKTQLQTLFTGQMYQDVKFEQESIILEDEAFRSKFEALISRQSYPEHYEGFYDGRFIRTFDIASLNTNAIEETGTAFFMEHKDLFAKLEAAKADQQTLENIEMSESKIRTFDYDGIRYKKKNIIELKTKVFHHINELEQSLKEKDEMVYRFFQHQKQEADFEKAERLTRMYQQYFKLNAVVKDMITYINTVPSLINPFYETNNLADARRLSIALTEETETLKLKINLLEITIKESNVWEQCPTPATLIAFRDKTWSFIDAQQNISGENIDKVWEALQSMHTWITDANFELQKNILEYQLQPA